MNWANISLFIILNTTVKIVLIQSYSGPYFPTFRIWNYLEKPPFIKVVIFLKRRSNKINTILYDRYYSQNCKAITFEKIATHTKYKNPNVPSHLHDDKNDKNLVASFEWGIAWVKMPWINAFSRNVNSINLKFFPTHLGNLRKIQQAFWREINP